MSIQGPSQYLPGGGQAKQPIKPLDEQATKYYFQTELKIKKGCFGRKILVNYAYLYVQNGQEAPKKVSNVALRVITKNKQNKIQKGLNFFEKFRKNHNTANFAAFQRDEATGRLISFNFHFKDAQRLAEDVNTKATASAFANEMDKPSALENNTPVQSDFRPDSSIDNSEVLKEKLNFLYQTNVAENKELSLNKEAQKLRDKNAELQKDYTKRIEEAATQGGVNQKQSDSPISFLDTLLLPGVDPQYQQQPVQQEEKLILHTVKTDEQIKTEATNTGKKAKAYFISPNLNASPLE